MSLTPISTTNHSDNSGVTFVLEAMALDVSLNKGIIIDSIVDAVTLSAHGMATLDISYGDISGVFQYRSDAIDVSGAGGVDESGNPVRPIDGISEETDAIVIIVSEEKSKVSLAENGKFVKRNLRAASLEKYLNEKMFISSQD